MSAFFEAKTKLGRWSVGLAAGFAVSLAVTLILAAVVAVNGAQPWAMAVGQPLGMIGMLLGLAAAVTCLVAVFAQHESRRFLWLLPGMLVLELLVLLAGETMVPH